MKPEEVPDDMALAAALALIRVDNEQDCGINDVATPVASQAWEDARIALAAVIPLIEAQERERVDVLCDRAARNAYNAAASYAYDAHAHDVGLEMDRRAATLGADIAAAIRARLRLP
jgi:hypothetical protein